MRVIRVGAGAKAVAAAVRTCARLLRAGELVIIPTDTVYGVAADPRVPSAVARLYAVKGRWARKPVALLAAGLRAVEAYGARLRPAERCLAAKFWPGPLTLVLKTGSGWEGFRVPKHALACQILRAAGGILRVSSANRSGEPPATSADAAVRALGSRVAAVVDAGPTRSDVPSTVVKVERGRIRILRRGVIPLKDLQACLRTPCRFKRRSRRANV